MSRKIRIVLIDDHEVVRAGFKMLIATNDLFEVVGEASRGEFAMQLYEQLKPDIIIMDLSMPGIGGLESIHRITNRYDQALILVFSIYNKEIYVTRALAAGAKGYITKNSAPELIFEAILRLVSGAIYVEAGLIDSNNEDQPLVDYQLIVSELSEREFDVFRLLVQGFSIEKISKDLCLATKTVSNYITHLKKKLHAGSLIELVKIAEILGVV